MCFLTTTFFARLKEFRAGQVVFFWCSSLCPEPRKKQTVADEKFVKHAKSLTHSRWVSKNKHLFDRDGFQKDRLFGRDGFQNTHCLIRWVSRSKIP